MYCDILAWRILHKQRSRQLLVAETALLVGSESSSPIGVLPTMAYHTRGRPVRRLDAWAGSTAVGADDLSGVDQHGRVNELRATTTCRVQYQPTAVSTALFGSIGGAPACSAGRISTTCGTLISTWVNDSTLLRVPGIVVGELGGRVDVSVGNRLRGVGHSLALSNALTQRWQHVPHPC